MWFIFSQDGRLLRRREWKPADSRKTWVSEPFASLRAAHAKCERPVKVVAERFRQGRAICAQVGARVHLDCVEATGTDRGEVVVARRRVAAERELTEDGVGELVRLDVARRRVFIRQTRQRKRVVERGGTRADGRDDGPEARVADAADDSREAAREAVEAARDAFQELEDRQEDADDEVHDALHDRSDDLEQDRWALCEEADQEHDHFYQRIRHQAQVVDDGAGHAEHAVDRVPDQPNISACDRAHNPEEPGEQRHELAREEAPEGG